MINSLQHTKNTVVHFDRLAYVL